MDSILPTWTSLRHCETRRAADLGGIWFRTEQNRSGLTRLRLTRFCPQEEKLPLEQLLHNL
jgi:ribosomal protein L33